MLQQFTHLFTPIRIGPVTFPNRIVMSAHATNVRAKEEIFAQSELDYWVARAKGGVGCITCALFNSIPRTTAAPPVALQDDRCIPHFERLASAIHDYGAKCIIQIQDIGGRGNSRLAGGGALWAPSAVLAMAPLKPFMHGGEVPHEMDIEEIERLVKAYGSAAQRLKQSGMDGVEIGASWGVLISQFMSPVFNLRTDEYGGSLEDRLRLPSRVIDSVREAVGPDFLVGLKIDGDTFVDGDNTLDDMKVIAQKLTDSGKVDYIFVNPGWNTAQHVPPMYYPLGAFVYLAAAIKEVVDIPVCAVGRINDPELAEKILAEGQADLVAMTRAAVCDPEFPRKAREGRLEEIRRCIGCNEGCMAYMYAGAPYSCVLNPEAMREKEFAIAPATSRKRVMVIGGGAAGLETARVAALRGHQVSLYERNDKLGGQLSIVAKAPMRADFEEVIRFYTYQMKLLGVEVHLNTEATPEMVRDENPDAVVVATGSRPFIPALPGSDTASLSVTEVRQVLQEEVEVGEKVVVVATDPHLQALEVADFLTDRGKRVEILTGWVYAGGQSTEETLHTVYWRLLSKGVIFTPLTKVREIVGNTVVTFNVLTNAESRIEGIDTVVFAPSEKANDTLYHSLKGKIKELYIAGHCLAPRQLHGSIHDGARIGRKL